MALEFMHHVHQGLLYLRLRMLRILEDKMKHGAQDGVELIHGALLRLLAEIIVVLLLLLLALVLVRGVPLLDRGKLVVAYFAVSALAHPGPTLPPATKTANVLLRLLRAFAAACTLGAANCGLAIITTPPIRTIVLLESSSHSANNVANSETMEATVPKSERTP